MTQDDLFSRPAVRARDAALAQVEDHAQGWCDRARAVLPSYPEAQATGEDLRLFVVQRIGPPHHHNATGAMIRGAIRSGILREVGFGHTTTERSHARRTPVYEIVRADAILCNS